MSDNPYKLLFITSDAQEHRDNTFCIYRSKFEYAICSYYELEKYLSEGYKRRPTEFEDEIKAEISANQDEILSVNAEIEQINQNLPEETIRKRGRRASK